jgi:hypothetical protein
MQYDIIYIRNVMEYYKREYSLSANPRILIITSSSLRHEYFAYKLESEFRSLFDFDWYMVKVSSKRKSVTKKNEGRIIIAKVIYKMISLLFCVFKKALCDSRNNIERKLFGTSLSSLKKHSHISPILIDNPSSNDFIGSINDKYDFILTSGGPLYSKELIDSAKIASINVHSGYSPDIKGGNSTNWALYFRKMEWVGVTIHLLSTGADDGPILNRSLTVIDEDDTNESIFLKTYALGTELMISTLRDSFDQGYFTCYNQPKYYGNTYRSYDWTPAIKFSVWLDVLLGNTFREYKRMRRF